jgi:hypothetical protein
LFVLRRCIERMTVKRHARSEVDADHLSKRPAMNPPAYHHTRSQGTVPMPLLEESEHAKFGELGEFANLDARMETNTLAGRLSPKWIEDFLAGQLNDDPFAPVLSVGCADASVPATSARQPHDLVFIGAQGVEKTPLSNSAGIIPGYQDIWSCLCQKCRYHFVFTITRSDTDEQTCCGVHNFIDPFHHLVFTRADAAHGPSRTKYLPALGDVQYQCSARRCGLKVTIAVSEPRLQQRFLDYLQDNERIIRNKEQAMRDEPERFGDTKYEPNALGLLRIYVKNIVEGNDVEKKDDGTFSPRKIDKRNKRFFIQFGNGEDSVEFFRYLEFEETTSAATNSEMWKVPNVEQARPTPVGSRQAFFQDIQSEIETIVAMKQNDLVPFPALAKIKQGLHIGEHFATTKVSNQYYQRDYDLLGITPEMHESIFWYAFCCQRQTNPARESEVFDSLQRLAQGRGNEALEIKVQSYDSMRTAPSHMDGEDDEIRRAKEMSLMDSQGQGQDVLAAYHYFGYTQLPETEDNLLGRFRAMCESSPAQISIHREKLLLIARASTSKWLEERAVDSMELEEATAYLGVKSDTDPDFITSTAGWLADVRPHPCRSRCAPSRSWPTPKRLFTDIEL